MKFVVGKEGSFIVSDRACVRSGGVARSSVFSKRERKFGPSIGIPGCSWSFTMKRGVSEEWRDHGQVWAGLVRTGGDGEYVYARILPPEMEPDLAELDADIAAAVEKVKTLCRERQEFLAANIVRGKRITAKDVESLPPLPPKTVSA